MPRSSGTDAQVLILDGEQRSALAATRSLGRHRIPVLVGGHTPRTLSGASRYSRGSIVYPSPYLHSERFIEAMKREIPSQGVQIVFPMTDVTTHLLLTHRAEFPDVTIPAPSLEMFEVLTDKWKLYQLARQLSVPTPATYLFASSEHLTHTIAQLRFPVVVKSCRSRIFSGEQWLGSTVQYASSRSILQQVIANTEFYHRHPFLLQEFIQGETHGVFALYDRGRPIAFFGHKRLREKPPSGGVSVLSESIAVEPRLREITQVILDHVRWHGVAMAEFKLCADGMPYLIEVNARFWGSLQLAIDAGVDFPWLLYQLAVGRSVPPVEGYTLGIRNRWLLGDLDHLYLVLKSGCAFSTKLRTLARFLSPSFSPTFYEINRWDDLRPFYRELRQYLQRPKNEAA